MDTENTEKAGPPPHRQRPAEAPGENRDSEGRLVGDSTESSGAGETAWGTTADLTPENADEASVEGYTNSPGSFEDLHLSADTDNTDNTAITALP